MVMQLVVFGSHNTRNVSFSRYLATCLEYNLLLAHNITCHITCLGYFFLVKLFLLVSVHWVMIFNFSLILSIQMSYEFIFVSFRFECLPKSFILVVLQYFMFLKFSVISCSFSFSLMSYEFHFFIHPFSLMSYEFYFFSVFVFQFSFQVRIIPKSEFHLFSFCVPFSLSYFLFHYFF